MKHLRIIILALLLPAFALATPNNPSNLTFTNVTSHSVTLNWEDNSEDETGFKILVNGKYLLKTAPDITQFTVGSLTPNTHYEFTVKATDSDYENNRATFSTDSQTYNENEDIVVNIKNLVNDREYWVGIYPKDASNDWGNMINWNRPLDQTTLTFDGIATGEYEARLFYSSSFELLEKIAFNVSNKVSISTNKQIYDINESIVTKFRNLVPNEDNWVGIYPKDASNDWGNMIKWNRPSGQTTLTFEDIASGEYEARLFYSDKFKLLAKVGFSIVDDAYVYGSEGAYLNNVKINNDSDKYIIYYPEGHVQNAPMVLVVGYSNTIKDDNHIKERLEGVMTYLASLGCYVIGHKNIEGSIWDVENRRSYFIDAVENAKNLGVDVSRFAVLGKSTGGMHAYALMKYFKEEKGYGSNKSFVLDLIGYYAIDMTKDALAGLNIDSLIIHYGGYTGVQTKYSQDPRTLLTISHILKHDDNKAGFIVIDAEDHSYEGGTYNEFKEKDSLMRPIEAMIKYEFFNQTGKYNDASNILFSQYEQTTTLTQTKTLEYLDGKSSEQVYGDGLCRTNKNGIDYCQDYR